MRRTMRNCSKLDCASVSMRNASSRATAASWSRLRWSRISPEEGAMPPSGWSSVCCQVDNRLVALVLSGFAFHFRTGGFDILAGAFDGVARRQDTEAETGENHREDCFHCCLQ